jgi:hypothetical protein
VKIALLISGHLRDNPIVCIQNALDELKQFNKPNVDLYINTFNVVGESKNSNPKNYKDKMASWSSNKLSSEKLIGEIDSKFEIYYLNIVDHKTFMKEEVEPILNNLQKAMKIKAPGLLSSHLSQSLQRSNICSAALKNIDKYDLILLTRPDINIKNIKLPNKIDEETVYYLKTTPYYDEDWLVSVASNWFEYFYYRNYFKEKNPIELIGETFFMSNPKQFILINEHFLSRPEDFIYDIDLEKYNYLYYKYKSKNKLIPTWEMPEFLYSMFAKKFRLKFEQIGALKLHHDKVIKEYRFYS